ncbi:MAG: hypothetical protein ACYSWP_14640, partial [Planctomycetota bacterium]
MKKLIMFVMVLVIGVPALAIMEDTSPPDWGGVVPRSTYVWHIDTEYGVPSCINYDPLVADPAIVFGTPGDGFPDPVGTWTPDPCNGTFTFNQSLSIYVETPPGVGPNLTLRVQAAFAGNMVFWTFPELYVWDEVEGRIPADRMELEGVQLEEIEEGGEGTGVWVLEGTFENVPEGTGVIGMQFERDEGGSSTMTGLIFDVIRHFGPAPTTGPGRVICDDTEPLPLIVDPNVMVVYEEGETRGDFDVYLARPPFGGTVTVVVDPNGGNGGWGEGQLEDKDIKLLAGDENDNQVTLTFDAGNWDVPQTVVFDALNDTVPEPPELLEGSELFLTLSHPTDPNFNGERIVTVNVMDNDQANILFTISSAYTTGSPTSEMPVTDPVQIWEEPKDFFGFPQTKYRDIGVTLQVEPSGGPVKILVDVELPEEAVNPNPPGTEVQLDPDKPDLPFEESDDPNGLIFTDGNWDTPQSIRIWGNDDAELQIEGAEAEGDENYTATLTFTVIDGGGDGRYWRQEPVL